jgi:hypothetical protein
MDTTRIVKNVTEWEPCSSRPVGRPRLRWLDQVEKDLKKMKVRNWREKCKSRLKKKKQLQICQNGYFMGFDTGSKGSF